MSYWSNGCTISRCVLPFALINLWVGGCGGLGLVLIMKGKKTPQMLSQFRSAMILGFCRFSQFPSKYCTCGRSSSAFWLHRSDFFFYFFSLCLTRCISFPLSFSEMLPCQWALGSDRYSEAQMGCLDTELGDELSHRAGSCSSICSSQDGAVCPVFLSSSPWCLALLCCFLHCSGWLKCLADRPLLKTYPSMASDLWRMRSNTLIQRAAWRGTSLYEFCQLQQEGQERKKGEKKGGLNSLLFSMFVILCVQWVLCQRSLDEAVFQCCLHTSDEDSHNTGEMEGWRDDGGVFKGNQSEKRNGVNDGCTELTRSAFTLSSESEKGKGTVLDEVSPTQTAGNSVQFPKIAVTGDFISMQEYYKYSFVQDTKSLNAWMLVPTDINLDHSNLKTLYCQL